jgi:transcriptional/translational regulatory protein YebC/TACO1
MAAIDAGAEDIHSEESTVEIVTSPENYDKVKTALKDQGFTPSSAEVTMVPSTTVKLEGEEAQKVVKLVSALEEHDDVQNVHANFDIPDEILEKAS